MRRCYTVSSLRWGTEAVAGWGTTVRSFGRRPWIPPEAAGLFAALGAQEKGVQEPLRAWYRTGFPALVGAIEAAWNDAAQADEIATEVAVRALRSVRKGVPVGNERPWMAAVAMNLRIDEWRRERRGEERRSTEARERRAAEGLPPFRSLSDEDDAEVSAFLRRVACALFLLPTPYREAMAWQKVEGCTRAEVCGLLCRWRGVTVEGARHILRRGHRMLRAAFFGADPRVLWPRSYPHSPKESEASLTLPPLPHRHVCGGRIAGSRPRTREAG